MQSLNLTIDHDAGRFTADSVLHLKSHEFRANADGMEPEIAVSAMVENLRSQLTKFKGKISGKQKGEEGGLGRAMMGDLGAVAEAGPLAFVLKDMDVSTAKDHFENAEDPFLVFRNVDNSRVAVIYRREDGQLGHMESQSDGKTGD